MPGFLPLKCSIRKGREVHARTVTDLNAGDVLEITEGKNNYTLGKAVKKGESITFLVQKQIRLTKGMLLNRIRNESLLQHIDTDIIGKKLQRPAAGSLPQKSEVRLSFLYHPAKHPSRLPPTNRYRPPRAVQWTKNASVRSSERR